MISLHHIRSKRNFTRPRPDGWYGWGANARGGGLTAPDPGAQEIMVENLSSDNVLGSLRAALAASGRRYIKFDPGLSGYIILQAELTVTNGGFTLDGSDAQVLIRGPSGVSNGFRLQCSDAVIRHMRFSRGDLTTASESADGVILLNANDIVFDHCSFFWGVDGTFDISGTSQRITASNCLFAHSLSLNGHSEPGGEGGGGFIRHSRSSLVTSSANYVSFHRCAWVHNEERNPQISIWGRVELINCVTAGWVSRGLRIVGAGGLQDPLVDVLSCLYAQTTEAVPYRPPSDTWPIGYDATGDPTIYVDDVWGVTKLGTKDRWPIGSGGDSWNIVGDYGSNLAGNEGTYRSASRVAASPIQPHRLPAADLWASLSADIGCRPDARMGYEQALVNDVTVMLARSGTQNYGIIDGVAQSIGAVALGVTPRLLPGGYPTLPGPAWYGLVDYGSTNAARYYTIPNNPALNLGNGAAWAWGFMARVVENDGPAYQYVLNTGAYGTASSFTINLHEDPGGVTPNKYELRTLDSGGTPNVYIASSSRPGDDGVLRLVVVQFNGTDTAEMIFCAPGGIVSSQGTFDVGATGSTYTGLSPADSWYVGARSDRQIERFWKSQLGGLFRANRLLTITDIQSIASGTSPVTVLGSALSGGACIEAWPFRDGAVASENGLVQGTVMAAVQHGTGWPA